MMQPDEVGAQYAALPGRSISSEEADQGFRQACAFILIVELVERLCYYTFAGSQEFFLEQLGYTVQESAGLNAAFSTLCYLWPLVGGYVADASWGRYTTIVRFSMAYFLGAAVCAVSALPGSQRSGIAYMVGSMGLLAIGTGGIKPNISNFGADQYDVRTEAGKKAQEAFYTQFYVVINIGALGSYGFMTTLCSNGFAPYVPRAYGYFAAYSVGAMAMGFALLLFVGKSASYRHKTPGGDPLRGVVAHILSAASRHPGSSTLLSRGRLRARAVALGTPAALLGVLLTVAFSFRPTRALLIVALIGLGGGLGAVAWGCRGCLEWVPACSKRDRRVSRQETADFLRVMPTLITVSLAFNALYNCAQFWFQQQACQMDLAIGRGGLQLSGSFFTIADSVSIILGAPLLMHFVNPCLGRLLAGGRMNGHSHGHGHGGLSRHAKLILGCSLATASVLWAAQLELSRRAAPLLDAASQCAPAGVHMSEISAWWMICPYAVMGLAEVYVNPTLYFLSYSQTPPRLRSTAQAVNLWMSAVASGIFTLLTNLMGSANDLNDSHLEYGYYASVCLALCFLGCYLSVEKTLTEKDFHIAGELMHAEESELEEEEEEFKEVAYQRFGFFRDFPSPSGSPIASPGPSPLSSPVPSPRHLYRAGPNNDADEDEDEDIVLVAEVH